MAVFPDEIAVFVQLPEGLPIDPVQQADYTGLRNEILAIEEELGINPAGELPTVAARLGVQFATGGGWRGFQFGTITSDFAAAQTLSFTGGRFAAAPQVLAINATGFAAGGEPAIFYTSDESETSAKLNALTRTGAFSSVSATVLWMAYLPPAGGNDDEETAPLGGGGIPPSGVEPDSQVVSDRPYYYDEGRQRWVSYETLVIVWLNDTSAITTSRYLNLVGSMNSDWGRYPITEDMVLIELAESNGGTSSSSSSVELRNAGTLITGASMNLGTAFTIVSASFNVDVPAGTFLQAYLTRGGSDSINVPRLVARLKYVR